MNITNSRFVFTRHANTDKNPVDTERTLTEKGRAQAVALKEKLNGVKFDSAICSSARRAQETILLVLGDNSGIPYNCMDVLYQLPDEAGRTSCGVMFKELGYASLREYLKHAEAETLHRFGQCAGASIAELLGESVSGKNVLVVSHAILINAIVYHMFPTEDVRNAALDANLGECGTIEVTVGETESDISVRVIE